MLASDGAGTRDRGRRAIELGEPLDEKETRLGRRPERATPQLPCERLGRDVVGLHGVDSLTPGPMNPREPEDLKSKSDGHLISQHHHSDQASRPSDRA
jgi:hypothetical protein